MTIHFTFRLSVTDGKTPVKKKFMGFALRCDFIKQQNPSSFWTVGISSTRFSAVVCHQPILLCSVCSRSFFVEAANNF